MNAEDAGRYLNRPINTSNSPDGEGYLVTYPGPRQAALEWHTQRIHREIAAIEAAGLTVESTIGEIIDAGVELDG